MKYKIAVFITATSLFCCLFTVYANAADKDLGSYNTIYIINNNDSYYYLYYCDSASSSNLGWRFSITASGNHEEIFTSYNDALNFIINNVNTSESYNPGYNSTRYYQKLWIVKGTVNGDIPSNTQYPDVPELDPPDPTWWERVAQIFTEFATSPAMGAVISGDWLGYINEVLFGELWSVQVGEGEDELAQFYTVSATPSPSPTPIPTQIPVQVNIDPTTGNVTYHYTIDVSGTPVPTSSPVNPNPPAGSCGGGSELTEPFGVTDYYEPDDSLSIPNLRIFQFQLDLPGSTTDIGVDSLDNNVEVMNGYLEDNADAITTVSSFFQVIPSDWFLLLGVIACFPIIAAMIKSLLGG